MAKKKIHSEDGQQPMNYIVCNDPKKVDKNIKEAEEMISRLKLKREKVFNEFSQKTFLFGNVSTLKLGVEYLSEYAKWDNIEVIRLKNTIEQIKEYIKDKADDEQIYVHAVFLENMQIFMQKDSGVGLKNTSTGYPYDKWIELVENLNVCILSAQPAILVDRVWKLLTDNPKHNQQPPMINGVNVPSLLEITNIFIESWRNKMDYGKSIEEVIKGIINLQIQAANLPEGSEVETLEILKKVTNK